MAKTQDLKRRIRSITNTRQLTKAMKMVSAAKLRRAQERITQARPYAQKQREVLQSLAAADEGASHPLLQVRDGKRTEFVVVTSDKGLCGAFNAQLTRDVYQAINERSDEEICISAIGRKGRDFFGHRKVAIRREHIDVIGNVGHGDADEIGDELIARYIAGDVDRILLCYNVGISAISANPTIAQLLPIVQVDGGEARVSEDVLYEPSQQALLEALLPFYVKNQVFQAMLESNAAEHGMRMAAMDAATRNAGELIDSLTLTMNRVRQASITTEIIEVVSGAEALG